MTDPTPSLDELFEAYDATITDEDYDNWSPRRLCRAAFLAGARTRDARIVELEATDRMMRLRIYAEEERDAALARVRELEAALGRANDGFEEYERRYYLETDKCDAKDAQIAALREAIQIHSECFTACARCGHEMPNADDDVCMVLSSSEQAARDHDARIRKQERERCAQWLRHAMVDNAAGYANAMLLALADTDEVSEP